MTDRPTAWAVGVKNSIGEELLSFEAEGNALAHVRELLEDGFQPEEIIVIEGRRRLFDTQIERVVHDVRWAEEVDA